MTDREIIQQALEALLHMCNTTKAQNDYNAKIVDKALVTLETALAQPEQDHGFDRTASHMAGEYVDTAQPEQEPVAWIGNADFVKGQFVEGRVRRIWWECNTGVGQPLYTAPPKHEWVGLTDDEIQDILDCGRGELIAIKKAEQLLKDKNTT